MAMGAKHIDWEDIDGRCIDYDGCHGLVVYMMALVLSIFAS